MTSQISQNKSFILYQEYQKNISILTQNQKGDLLDAIFSYNEGIEIELDPIVKMAFSFIKSDLNRNKAKYQNIIERNKINGASGGRPKNPEKPKEPSGLFGNPEKPKETLNGNDNVNVNVDKDDNKNEYDNLNNNSKGVEIVDLLSQKMADLESLFNKQTNALEYGNSDFENFWQYYTPVTGKDGSSTGKGGKNEAMQVYNKARKEFSHLTIMTNLEFYLKDCQKNARFTKHVSSWLRQAHKDKFHCEVSTVIKSQAPPQKLNRDQEQDRINEEFLKLYAKN